jgi:hypothetical protein
VCCSDDGVPSFDRIRYRRHAADVFLYAFDLIELNGDDLRRVLVEPQARGSLGHDRSSPTPDMILGANDRFSPDMGRMTFYERKPRSSGQAQARIDTNR